MKIDLASFFRHAFTLSKKDREQIAKIPHIAEYTDQVKHLATAAAVAALADHIKDPGALASAATSIGAAIDHAVPTPKPAVQTANDVVEHITSGDADPGQQ